MKISYLVGSQTYANYLCTVSTISVLICSAAHDAAHPTSSISRHAQALQQALVLLERIIHHVRSSKYASTSVNFDTRALLPRALYLSPRSAPISPLATLVRGMSSSNVVEHAGSLAKQIKAENPTIWKLDCTSIRTHLERCWHVIFISVIWFRALGNALERIRPR